MKITGVQRALDTLNKDIDGEYYRATESMGDHLARVKKGKDVLLWHSAPGLLPKQVLEAQKVIDRAVEGGYFDSFDGQPDSSKDAIDMITQRAIELLFDQYGEMEVFVVWDHYVHRTRILIAPPIGTVPPPATPAASGG